MLIEIWMRMGVGVVAAALLLVPGCGPVINCDDCSGGGDGDGDGPGGDGPGSADDGDWATGAQADTEDIGETEGLNCGGEELMVFLSEGRLLRAAEVDGFAGLDPEGYLLVLSSVPGICDELVDGFDCSDPHEYRFYVEVPADGLSAGSVLDFQGPDPEVDAWLQASLTPGCEASVPEEGQGHVGIDTFDPGTLEVTGRICNHYSPLLGFGLSGYFGSVTTCDR